MIKCQKCGAELEESAKFCTNCGEKVSTELIQEISIKKHEGLGGWLILVGIGVVLSPLRQLAKLSKAYLPIFNDGTWEALTTPTSESYNSSFSSLLMGEIFFNSLIIIASLYLIYLFFAKKSFFPKLYIWILVFSLIFILLDAVVVSSLFPNIEVFDVETMKEIGRTVIVSLIWIPYMLISKRVKATFVN
ncbi:MAG: DUF2569 family protein [Sulfurovum sp.]|nr:DUF2569 family protein [Sulfurovum sp.]